MSQIGTVELIAKIDTAQYKRGASEIDSANKQIESSATASADNSSNAFTKVAKIGLAAVASAAIAAGAIIISNVDNAIKRVDTLNNSARTFENLGFSAKDVDSAMKALDKSIRGLPTPLDEAVRGVQMIAGATNDVGKSQQIFSAINDAVIGFGGTTEDVSGSVMQLSQAFSNGRIDAQTWNSMIQNGLGPALNGIARQMGITTGALKEGLSDGTIAVESFQDALIKMDKEGGGGMKSFATIAKDATSGISTGWANLNTAITRGIASIIQAVGSPAISEAMTKFGATLEGGLRSFGTFLTNVIPKIQAVAAQVGEYLGPKFEALANTIETRLLPVFMRLWNEVLVPIAPFVGTVLVVAFGWLIDSLNFIITVATALGTALFNVINWFQNLINWIGQTASTFRSSGSTMADAVNWVVDRVRDLLNIFGTVKGSISDALSGVAETITAPFREAFNEILKGVDKVKKSIGSIKGGAANIGQDIADPFKLFHRASGGPVTAGQPYIVGEKRPELFVPNTNGTIIPEVPSGGSNVTVHVTMSGIMTRSKADERYIAKSLVKRINEELESMHQRPIGGGAIV